MKKPFLTALIVAFASFAGAYAQTSAMLSPTCESAYSAINADDYPEAVRLFKDELAAHPKNAEALHGLAIAYYYMGEYDSAVATAEKAFGYAKKDKELAALIASSLADFLINNGESEKGLKYSEKAIALDPTNVTYICDHLDRLNQAELHDAKKPYAEKLIINFPQDARAQFALGNYYDSLGDDERAIGAFTKAIQLAPEPESTYYFYRAVSYGNLNRWEETTKDIIAAIEVDNNETALAVLEVLGNEFYDVAAPVLQRRIDTLASSSDKADQEKYLTLLGAKVRFLYAADKHQEAFDLCDTLIDAYQRNGDEESRNMYARYKIMIGFAQFRFEEMIGESSKLLQMEPDNTELRMGRSIAYMAVGNISAAISDLSYVIDASPWQSEQYKQRARLYLDNGDYVKAIEDCDTALDFTTDDPKALYLRAMAYLMIDRRSDAERDLATVLALEGDDEDTTEAKCMAHAVLGHREEALAQLDSVEFEQAAPKLIFSARAHALLGDKDEALRQLEALPSCGDPLFKGMLMRAEFKTLADDPRFQALQSLCGGSAAK